MRRKAQFYVLTVLFPCILTGSVAAVSFILPPESGEKVSLSVTVLLSLAVFLLMVSEQLPASSDTFPYIGTTCTCIYIYKCEIVTITVESRYLEVHGTVAKFRVIRNSILGSEGLSKIGNSVMYV